MHHRFLSLSLSLWALSPASNALCLLCLWFLFTGLGVRRLPTESAGKRHILSCSLLVDRQCFRCTSLDKKWHDKSLGTVCCRRLNPTHQHVVQKCTISWMNSGQVLRKRWTRSAVSDLHAMRLGQQTLSKVKAEQSFFSGMEFCPFSPGSPDEPGANADMSSLSHELVLSVSCSE